MFKESIKPGFYEISHKLAECPDGSNYNNHTHTYCEILLFISGTADFNIDGTIYSPHPYDLLLIPDTKYHYLIPKSGSPYENYVIGFDRAIISENIYNRIFSEPHIINIRDNSELCGFFTRLDFYHENYSNDDFEKCASLLIQELLVYISYLPKKTTDSAPFRHKQVDDIIDIINENITERLNAEYIAKRLFLSKSYVQNVFSNVMHIGLRKYIIQRKIFCASKDISEGMPLGRAAEKYSFTDYSSFYRAYKETFGCSPRAKKN